MNRIDVLVPDGVSGEWRVETFAVSQREADLANLRASIGRPLEAIAPGNYKRLMRGNTLVMSNTPMEVRTNGPIVRNALGDVLINGLGLGMVLTAILQKPDVRTVTVVEKHRDVINLVGPTFADERVSIIHEDAFTFTPPKRARFDAVWHDIWDDITADNLPDMGALHRRYARRAGWQASWCHRECLRYS